MRRALAIGPCAVPLAGESDRERLERAIGDSLGRAGRLGPVSVNRPRVTERGRGQSTKGYRTR